MAGEWIKMRTSLLTSPKVNGIARALECCREVSRVLAPGSDATMSEIVTRDVMRHVTVSLLLTIWGAANEHTEAGVFAHADLSDIDDIVGVPGFGAAMESVGWLVVDSESVSVHLPNFDEYNTSSSNRSAAAKTSAERQRDYRARKKSPESNVTRNVTRNVTSNVTSNRREEKRREEIKEDNPPLSGAPLAASPRASRKAPKTFAVTHDLAAWAASDVPDVHIGLETEKFCDHTFRSAISDWPGAWRNWMRREQKHIAEKRSAKARPGPVSFADQARARMDALTGRAQPIIKHMGEISDAAELLDR